MKGSYSFNPIDGVKTDLMPPVLMCHTCTGAKIKLIAFNINIQSEEVKDNDIQR